MINSKLQNILDQLQLASDQVPDQQTWQKLITNLSIEFDQLEAGQKNSVKLTYEKFNNYIRSTSKLLSLSKLIGGVCHEINTPLAVIQIRSDQLLESIETGNFDKELFFKAMTSIDVTAKRIGTIISRLRNYARSGGLEEPLRTSVKKFLEDLIKISRDQFVAIGATIELKDAPDFDAEIKVSEISHILLGLIANSLEAIQSSSKKSLIIEFQKVGCNVIIDLIDSGVGIPSNLKDKIMEPFFTTSVNPGKMGLGLTIARTLANENNGSLTLISCSQPTKFRLNLVNGSLPDISLT